MGGGKNGLCQTREVSVDGREEFSRIGMVERMMTGNLHSERGVRGQ